MEIKTLQLSYQDSMLLRGWAILMMLFLHCFNYHPQDTYFDFVIFGNTLSWWLTKIAGLCVPLYCFLSGYGLYKKYPYGYDYCFRKTYFLVKRYWFFLLLFYLLGVVFFNSYSIELNEILSNFLGYDTTYNPTLWFLLPYLIIMIVSPILIKWFKFYKMWKSLIVVSVAYILAFFCLKMNSEGIWMIPVGIRVLLSAIHLAFSFMLGAIVAELGIPRLRLFKNDIVRNNFVLFVFLLLLICFRALIDNSILAPPICLILIVIITNIRYSEKWRIILYTMGKHSLNMWFIHAYFTYSYLGFIIYWSKFPLLIFLLLVLVSYIISALSELFFKRFNI
ncbi:acyltransferase family protein [uncultured Bacteroides sp.]|uniref:acyltransferase family protein n=1 Tax=uncultured Bacteroides sp. TaxID=162156 RepID=UPI0026185382|nr:acyltransferase family protein [uncultured Bacteroides sp.]